MATTLPATRAKRNRRPLDADEVMGDERSTLTDAGDEKNWRRPYRTHGGWNCAWSANPNALCVHGAESADRIQKATTASGAPCAHRLAMAMRRLAPFG